LSTPLLIAYAVGGGIPPATYEALRVYEDGVARAIVGNAWPFGAPQDEAGSYEHRLPPAEAAALTGAVAGLALPDAPVASDPLPADSGRCELLLGDGRQVVWSTTERPPEPLGPVVERMRDVLASTRRHPVGALALALEPPPGAAVGEPVALGLTLHNPGHEPVRLEPPGEPGRLRALATPADRGVDGRPDLEALVAGEPLAVPAGAIPAVLAPGERRTVSGQLTIATPGRWRLDALTRLDADLPYEGDTVRLECVALAGPVVVTVSG
jgi:hypothetical protein